MRKFKKEPLKPSRQKIFDQFYAVKKLTRWQAAILLFLARDEYNTFMYQKAFFKVTSQYNPEWNISDVAYAKTFRESGLYQRLFAQNKAIARAASQLQYNLRHVSWYGHGSYFPNFFELSKRHQRLIGEYSPKSLLVEFGYLSARSNLPKGATIEKAVLKKVIKQEPNRRRAAYLVAGMHAAGVKLV